MKLLLTFLGFFLVSLLSAQDIIILKDGNEIKARILEIGITEIKYKTFDNADGPDRSLLKTNIFMIKYEGGQKEVFNQTVTEIPQIAPVDSQDIKMKMYYKKRKKPGTAVCLGTLIPVAGPVIAQGYAKKHIGWGIFFATAEIASFILAGTGIRDEDQGYYDINGIYQPNYVTVYLPQYYIGLASWVAIACISGFTAGNDVKQYNKKLYNKIFNVNNNKGFSFQIAPSNKGIYTRLVYKF